MRLDTSLLFKTFIDINILIDFRKIKTLMKVRGHNDFLCKN